MPKPLGELYYALHNEIVWVHLKWNDFRGLTLRHKNSLICSMRPRQLFFTAFSG